MSDKFARTRAALHAFDVYTEQVWAQGTGEDFGRHFAARDQERERLAREVGRAYGLDTPECNSVDTCEQCVRPSAWLRAKVSV